MPLPGAAPLSGTAALHSKEKKRAAAQKSSFLTLKHSRLLQRCRNGCSWEPIDFPPSASQVITERKMSALRRKTFRSSSSLSTPFSFFFFPDQGGKREGDSDEGRERQEVRPRPFPHGDTDSDVVTPRHYLIQPPPSSSYLATFSSLFSPRPYTKLSALWTFLTIYVGQGQDRLNRSASLSPCR